MSARENLNRLLRFLTRHLIIFETHGLENIPKQGRLIAYINHINFLDPVLACALIRREVVPLSKVENFHHPLIGPLAKAYGAIPVNRGAADIQAYKRSLAVLNAEKVLLIAPEGTRSHHGRLQQAKDGFVLLALRTNSPLIPIGLVGQEKFPARFRRLRRTRVSVWVGRPFRFRVPEGLQVTRREVKAMTLEAMRELAALLPPANRGLYSEGIELPRQWLTYEW